MVSPRGRAGGARDFCSSACLKSCSSVPEDPASLLINRLAGKWAIKTSLRIELDLRRPAGVVPHSSSMHEEIFENSRKAQISLRIEAVKLDYTSRFVRVIH